jgi:hypothetical protein
VVECFGHCPVYEISEEAAVELQDNPRRRTLALEVVTTIKADRPTDVPTIGMSEGRLRISTRSSDVPPNDGEAYLAARSRVLGEVIHLVQARGVGVSIDVDPHQIASEELVTSHKVELTYKRSTRIVEIDHETFMDAEFFRTLVLHQLEKAIDELASGM